MRVYAVGGVQNRYCATNNCAKHTNFEGYKIHIVDNGAHADNMVHFAKGIVNGIGDTVDVLLYRPETNMKHSALKQIKSVKEKLEFLNKENVAKPDEFVAIPLAMEVSLNPLAEAVGYPAKTILPSNIHIFKATILNYLKGLEDKRAPYWLDPDGQGLEYAFGAIEQINELVKKGVRVYLPAAHPIEGAIKARAEQKGVKDKLYDYISSNGVKNKELINGIVADLKKENAYRFNVLALSDARVVNIKDLSGQKDYIFSAYDTCINDGARGVFNFYPVRDSSGNILGYSYTDKFSIHYPVREFPANEEFANIAKFVGRPAKDCLDSPVHHHMLRQLIDWEEPHDDFPDLLYAVDSIYMPKRLREEKIHEKGSLVDKSEKLFFDINDCYEVIFRKTDCEGSGRPSVLPMWGSCFATINAIKRDISKFINSKKPPYTADLNAQILRNYDLAEDAAKEGEALESEGYLNRALTMLKPYEDDVEAIRAFRKVYFGLYTILLRQNKNLEAEMMANALINTEAKQMREMFKNHYLIKDFSWLTSANYWDVATHEIESFVAQKKRIARWYGVVARLCAQKGNEEAAKISEWATRILQTDHHKATSYINKAATDIVQRRASGVLNIRDIYDDNYKLCVFKY